MNIKDNLGLILIIVGALISITLVGVIIGVPLVLVGAYLLNKKVKSQEENISVELQAKKDEIANIDEKLAQIEKDKEAEINQKLFDKQKELDNIEETLDKLEAERIAEVDEKIKDKKEALSNLDEKYEMLENQKKHDLNNKIKFTQDKLDTLKKERSQLEKELVLSRDDVEMQSFGLYEPKYNFINATSYKERLDAVRKQQKQMIKENTAAWGNPNMTLDGDLRKGQKMIKDNIKQILRTFNLECENAINKVKHSNLESSEKRIKKSFDQLNKLNEKLGVRIN